MIFYFGGARQITRVNLQDRSGTGVGIAQKPELFAQPLWNKAQNGKAPFSVEGPNQQKVLRWATRFALRASGQLGFPARRRSFMAYPARIERFQDAETYQNAPVEYIRVTNEGASFMRGVLVATLLALPIWGIVAVAAFRLFR